jgi:glycosyltransferase 2 family protein
MKKSLINRRNKGLWLRLGGTLLTLALLVLLLTQQGWNEILTAVRSISFWRFALAIGLMLISRMAVCGRWHVLLKSAGLNISFKDSTRLTFSGLFATNFLPTTIGGDVVRLAGAVQLKYDVSISTASLIVDRLVGMAGMAMTLPFGIFRLMSVKPIGGAGSSYNPSAWLSLSFISKNKWFSPLWEKGNRFLRQVLSAFSDWLKHPRGLFNSLVFTWIHMLCWFGAITLLLHGMGETITFWQVAGLWSFVYFITQIPISINGYGLQEVSMAFIYTNLGGISYQSSLTIALLLRTLTMFASLPGAVFVPGILEARAKQAEKTPEDLPVITPD